MQKLPEVGQSNVQFNNDPNRAENTDPITNRPWMRDALFAETEEEESTIDSLTPLAKQRNWRVPSEFPKCPKEVNEEPLCDYAARLEPDSVFSRNMFRESIIVNFGLSKDNSQLSVLCYADNVVKNFALALITFEEGNYIHTSCGTFFTLEGAEKSHCQLIGEPWEGEDTIDDFC
jgi:hypothetical protein